MFRSTHPEIFNHKRSNGGKREDLGGLYVRSTWEANWARYLNWLVSVGEIQNWKYESRTFEFPVKKGSKYYTPDFEVTNKNGSVEYHEIKGYMDQASATKLKRMAKYFPDDKLILIEKAAYYSVARKVGRLVPNWESGDREAFEIKKLR
jgi:hypothetical protein